MARQTVVVRLFAAVLAARRSAVLAGCEFLKARRLDRIELLMLATMRDNFVRVGADKVALQTVEMGRFILGCTCKECLI